MLVACSGWRLCLLPNVMITRIPYLPWRLLLMLAPFVALSARESQIQSGASLAPGAAKERTATAAEAAASSKGRRRYIVTFADGGMRRSQALSKLSMQAVLRSEETGLLIQDLDEAEAQLLREDKENVLTVEEDGPILIGDGSQGISPSKVIHPQHARVRMGLDDHPLSRVNGVDEGKDLTIAIIDSGINPHEDLNVVHFWSPFTNNRTDEIGHGTAVAGIVGAKDNGIGVTGIAAGARLWNIKMISPTRNAWSYLVSSMNYVLQNASEVSIVNISIGNEGTSAPVGSLRTLSQRLVRAGVVVVAGVGNRNIDMAGPDGIYNTGDDALPASLPEVFSVSAMDSNFESTNSRTHKDVFWVTTPGGFGSNYSQIPRPAPLHATPNVVYPMSPGGAIDVVAPGYLVDTTSHVLDSDGVGRRYAYGTGSSYAGPHVAGLVGLYILANGRPRNEQEVFNLRQAIINAGQPQSAWAAPSQDPDNNPEPLAFMSSRLIPKARLSHRVLPGSMVELTVSTGSDDCDRRPCSVPGLLYTLQATSDLVDWIDVATLAGTGRPLVFGQAMDQGMRFYRVREAGH